MGDGADAGAGAGVGKGRGSRVGWGGASCAACPRHLRDFPLQPSAMRRLHSLLILGRVSNLPPVWSNTLAGWWLGGGGHVDKFPFVFSGLTLLYLGGMFLNDAFDVEFDRVHRQERPIPSGAISVTTVWRLGLTLLGAGVGCLLSLGTQTGAL